MRAAKREPATGEASAGDSVGRGLDLVEKAFSSVVAAHQQELTAHDSQPVLMRERWGGLDVILSWTTADAIERYVYAEIQAEETNPSQIELPIVAYAWQTAHGAEHELTRKFKQVEMARLKMPLRAVHGDRLQQAVNRAYAEVSRWTGDDLDPVITVPQRA